MKKAFVLLFLIASTLLVNAQKVGLKGGLNLAKLKAVENGTSVTMDNLTTFHVGLVYEKPLSTNFFYTIGALYTQKGFNSSIEDVNVSMKINYIHLPLDFTYKSSVGESFIFIQGGPFVSIALSGKTEMSFGGDSESQNIEFGTKDDQCKRLDFGLKIGAGIEVNTVQLSVGYDFGLVNLQNTSEAKIFTRTLQISACLFF